MAYALFGAVLFLCVAAPPSPAQQEYILRWEARELFLAGRSSAMILDGETITLENHCLVEDDAPGCGYSSNPSSAEILQSGIVLKKTLLLHRLPARSAAVVAMFYPENPPHPNNGRHVVFTVNGTDIPYEVKHFWTSARIPRDLLKLGKNEILVRTLEPDTRFKTWIALDENFAIGSSTRTRHPNRSARSTDGGKTWDDGRLGINAAVDGEYSIRLALDAYKPAGWFESPVIDLAENSNHDALQVPVKITDVTFTVTKELREGTDLTMEVRSGSTLSPDAGGWTPWAATQGVVAGSALKGRYAQFRLLCTSSASDASPRILGAAVRSRYTAADTHVLTPFRSVVAERHPLIRSSFPFAYEQPHHPRLQQFRTRMNLDTVVGDARTEFEKMVRIKGWVARQWQWRLLRPEEDILEWDAVRIMTSGPGGRTEGGFCLHYAVVLQQALQSFGFPARIVSVDYSIWGGHEVVEAWSNEFGKWIFLDGNFDTYFVDKTTGVPMSILEMHDLFLRSYYPGESINRDSWSREDLARRAGKTGKPPSVAGVVGGNANAGTLKSYEWWNPPVELSPYCGGYGPTVMGYIRYMPRANTLSEPRPVPVNHGRTHWGWTGYYCWYDAQTPRSLEHETFTSRPSDLYWNINQIDFRAVAVKDGVLQIGMVTHAPDFSAYEVTVNGKTIRTREPVFEVRTERGKNRIEMRVADALGNLGSASTLQFIYIPASEEN